MPRNNIARQSASLQNIQLQNIVPKSFYFLSYKLSASKNLCNQISTFRPPVDNGTSNGRPYQVRLKSSFVTNGRPADVRKTY